MYMEIIKQYKAEHFNNNIEVADNIIGDHSDINSLISSLNDKSLLIWLRACNIIVKNNEKYFSETSTMLTISIRMFQRELDVKDNISMTNKQILSVFQRFHNVIKTEFINRLLNKEKEREYTLLTD